MNHILITTLLLLSGCTTYNVTMIGPSYPGIPTELLKRCDIKPVGDNPTNTDIAVLIVEMDKCIKMHEIDKDGISTLDSKYKAIFEQYKKDVERIKAKGI